VRKKGGGGILTAHSTLEAALRIAYPEFPWDSLSFGTERRPTNGFWKDLEHQRALMDKIGQTLKIQEVC